MLGGHVGWPCPVPPRRPQSQCTWWIVSDHADYNPITTTSHTLKGQTQWAPKPQWSKSCSVESTPAQHQLNCSHSQSSLPIDLGVNPSQWGQLHSRFNYNRTVRTAHTGAHLERPAQVTGEAVPLGPTGHLLHKAILPSLGDVAALT